MRKHFVLDTNVLLHDPGSIFAFGDNHVILPIYVIEEIDQFKKELSERGHSAREVARSLDELRGKGTLAKGVDLDKGGTLKVAIAEKPLADPLREKHLVDNYILSVALEAREAAAKNGGGPTVLVTKDINLRIRADALGLAAEDYLHDRIEVDELYSGQTEREVPGEDVNRFFADGELKGPGTGLYPNQYVLLRDVDSASHTALSRWDAKKQAYVAVRRLREPVWGIKPRNKEQHYALDLLLNDDIKLVTLVGKAGTGKTLVAIAAGLQKVVEENVFHKLLVSRPIFPLGRDVGFLPGALEEKLNPWMQPIYDNIDLLMGIHKGDRKEARSYTEFFDMGYIEVEPLTYIRGRSIPNQYLIVDEAQNLTPHEIKTIVTRVGDGTKIVITGDPYQIDNPYVDAANNGLTTVVERFKIEPLAGHVSLIKGERSELAEAAATLM